VVAILRLGDNVYGVILSYFSLFPLMVLSAHRSFKFG
jgi:hypothetical protein